MERWTKPVSGMVWCGDLEVEGRAFHACVYTTMNPSKLLAVVRDPNGLTTDISLDASQPVSLPVELKRILRKKTESRLSRQLS